MPQITQKNVQSEIQYILNSTTFQHEEFFENVQTFGDTKFLTVYMMIAVIPAILAVWGNFKVVFAESQHSTMHCLEGLLPIAICSVFLWSSLCFSQIAWTKPIYAFLPMSMYFSLNCSRVIIATVTKKEFSIFIDFHLSVPILLSTLSVPSNHAFKVLKEEHLFTGIIVSNIFVYLWYINIVIG